jgi:hypothetical protein
MRKFIKLIHQYGTTIINEDTPNAEKFFKYFINNTSYLNFGLEFYQSVLCLFHRKHVGAGVQQSILKVLARAELFVDRFVSKFDPDNKSIMKKKSLMIYFASLIISNYYDYFAYERLNGFLLLFEKNTDLFRDLKNLFFILNHSKDPRLNTIKVNISGLFKDYNQVSLESK